MKNLLFRKIWFSLLKFLKALYRMLDESSVAIFGVVLAVSRLVEKSAVGRVEKLEVALFDVVGVIDWVQLVQKIGNKS